MSRLDTDRLQLRPWDADDWLLLKPIATDPRVMRYIGTGQPWSDERIGAFVERQRGHHARLGFCLWKLIERGSGTMIGLCGLQPLGNEIEVGWWLATERWGEGFASEAARSALRFAIDEVGLDRVVAIIHAENQASMQVARRIGMSLERATTCAEFDKEPADMKIVLFSVARSSEAYSQSEREG
jgi:RimJ/RimL family protein N-acetyltransferase